MKDENRIERFTTHWQRDFKDEPYYSEKYSWEDFDPAYRYAYKSYEENPHARFEDLETRLEAGWDIAKGKSKLAWADAKQADPLGLEQRRARASRRFGSRRTLASECGELGGGGWMDWCAGPSEHPAHRSSFAFRRALRLGWHR